jgi:hypothetical protein
VRSAEEIIAEEHEWQEREVILPRFFLQLPRSSAAPLSGVLGDVAAR